MLKSPRVPSGIYKVVAWRVAHLYLFLWWQWVTINELIFVKNPWKLSQIIYQCVKVNFHTQPIAMGPNLTLFWVTLISSWIWMGYDSIRNRDMHLLNHNMLEQCFRNERVSVNILCRWSHTSYVGVLRLQDSKELKKIELIYFRKQYVSHSLFSLFMQ